MHLKRYFILILSVAAISTCRAGIVGKYYRGTLDTNEIEMTLEFDTSGKVDGFYHIIGVNRMNYVHGNYSDAAIMLTDYRFVTAKKKYGKSGEFSGLFSGQSFSGKYLHDSTNCSFELTENFEGDGIGYSYHSVNIDEYFRGYLGVKNLKEHCALQYTLFDSSNFVASIFDSAVFRDMVPYGLESFSTSSFFDYGQLAKEFNLDSWYEQRYEGQSMGYEWDGDCSVIWNGSGVLSFFTHHSSWTGGVHGNWETINRCYDLRTGKQIKLDDIFIGNYLSLLERKVDEHLDDADLKASGSAYVNDNFYITPDGICFYYNVYEIGCYVQGSQVSFIPWSELNSYIDPNGPMGWVRK